jgi:hypothetical protein
VGDFLNRVKKNYRMIHEGALTYIEGKPHHAGKDGAQLKLVAKDYGDFMVTQLFLNGLNENIMREVRKSDEVELDKLVLVAKRAERSLQPATSTVAAAGMMESQDPEQSQPKTLTMEEVQQMITAAVKKQAGKPNQKEKKSSKDQERKNPGDLCYFCFGKGHRAKECTMRNKERDEGKYRPTCRCPVMTKEAYNKLPYDEKTKGKNMAAASSSTSTVQPQMRQSTYQPEYYENLEGTWRNYAGN